MLDSDVKGGQGGAWGVNRAVQGRIVKANSTVIKLTISRLLSAGTGGDVYVRRWSWLTFGSGDATVRGGGSGGGALLSSSWKAFGRRKRACEEERSEQSRRKRQGIWRKLIERGGVWRVASPRGVDATHRHSIV